MARTRSFPLTATLALGLAAVAILVAPTAHAADWALVPAKSSLTFTAQQQGVPFTGGFRKFDASVRFDPADLARTKIAVEIDATSIYTGASERDRMLPGPEWFYHAAFPKARFSVSGITRETGDRYRLDAELTIRDVSRKVSLPATIAVDGNTALAKGTLKIGRTDWGVGQGQWASGAMVGIEVDIAFDITATRK